VWAVDDPGDLSTSLILDDGFAGVAVVLVRLDRQAWVVCPMLGVGSDGVLVDVDDGLHCGPLSLYQIIPTSLNAYPRACISNGSKGGYFLMVEGRRCEGGRHGTIEQRRA